MSDVKPSVNPVSVLLEPGERSPVDTKSADSVAAGLVGLVYLAREAADEKRHKQCLEATRAILQIDPDHNEARKIQETVRAALDQQFADAQTLAGDARLKDDPGLYERAATALRRIVDADPHNLEARTLLQDTVAASYFRPAPPTIRPRRKVPPRSIVVGSVATLVLVAAMQSPAALRTWSALFTTSEPRSERALVAPPDQPAAREIAVYIPLNNPPTASDRNDPAWSETTLTASTSVRVEDSNRVFRVDTGSRGSKPVASPMSVAAAPPMGALAVSAAVPVEIYRGDENLGSTPATLQLVEGPHTLEYRYEGLRQTLTHLITREQTTTATVSFPVKIQINAQPWAQVFMDGIKLMPIGQTPLGDVSVPIGSVLIFRNPNFPDKRYRVTAKDTAIRITFP
ncbi:MAG TPA: bacterial transcriptional activator domain-containing protein [Terriglobia bacterium]|nr:bacterial transcriptional activator domain-containing protein [Terriglobia bacterium]